MTDLETLKGNQEMSQRPQLYNNQGSTGQGRGVGSKLGSILKSKHI